jgi:hypothetical protein
MGEWRNSSTMLDFGTRWRWVVSFRYRLRYTSGNSPPPRFPFDRRLGGPRSLCGRCGEEKISCSTGNRTRALQPIARVGVTVVLPSLHINLNISYYAKWNDNFLNNFFQLLSHYAHARSDERKIRFQCYQLIGNFIAFNTLVTRHPCSGILLCLATFTRDWYNRPWRPIGLWDVEAPTFSLDNRFADGDEDVNLTRWPPFTPHEDSWYSFLLEAESTPGP